MTFYKAHNIAQFRTYFQSPVDWERKITYISYFTYQYERQRGLQPAHPRRPPEIVRFCSVTIISCTITRRVPFSVPLLTSSRIIKYFQR